ncbi:hypothetical protein RFI_37494 [Reticulomyxa filosa]|uniref:Uncharacterized protein n=1 Tax=Reticulomyxa filosa TaxID=46433 RepID=X6LGX4_RETFI|nr:hypothetical protein RFI_37494 [Reticulomyxa filosa]|eukprot:ETN99964.1 hypothetical protein RFI_37494 [Reticulomyxa filosa]
MLAEEVMEGRVDTVTLDKHNGDWSRRQLIAMILEEADDDADGNKDNEYSDQANEQEDPLKDSNLLPWAKEDAFVEQVYMQHQQQKFKNIPHGHQIEEDDAVALLRVILERRKYYRFHPIGKTICFTVTHFQADLTIPKIILVHKKRQRIGLQINIFSIFFFKNFFYVHSISLALCVVDKIQS